MGHIIYYRFYGLYLFVKELNKYMFPQKKIKLTDPFGLHYPELNDKK